MYIPYLLHTPGSPSPLPQTNPLIPRDESPPSSTHNEGFWEVQFNFWGTILAFLVAIGIITGILTWCLVCRGKRMEKKLARAKEKELAEEERRKTEMVGRVVGADGAREGGVSRPLNVGTGSSRSGSLGEKELEVERGVGMGMGTDIPIYNPRDVLANKRGSTHTTITSVSEGNGWHKVEVNGKMYMDRERTESTFMEREIKFV
ncbi:03c617bd-5cbc-4e34-875e-233f4c334a1e [Sclerotinia trifoliorum]|uniref:03c617bd-5cbc-4e34-875e-233f4c334a1e n=1 Tax=Sclerotinia trifoliorum TaxID=28548 RepID=A0A8H2ZQQ4_9HELO|nr:03c617bd-5cbc-4e34-875e-233f4c334a1e [Sclerotinia trifoliorum]